jgi:hypothetical protein
VSWRTFRRGASGAGRGAQRQTPRAQPLPARSRSSQTAIPSPRNRAQTFPPAFRTKVTKEGSTSLRARSRRRRSRVGQIQPRQKFQVKSKISGIVKPLLSSRSETVVKAGDPLFEIAPDPTPLEMTEVDRRVESGSGVVRPREAEFERAQELSSVGRHGPIRARRQARGLRAREDRPRQGGPGPELTRKGRHVVRLDGPGVDHPRAGRRHDPDPRGEPGRPGRSAHVVSAGHRAGDDRR